MSAIWYFDFISPFAYLQCARMRDLSAQTPITPKPIVFAAILKHHGQLGPAEIAGKREFTYRMVQWSAESTGVEVQRRNAIVADPRIRGYRSGQYYTSADGGLFVPARS